MNNHQFTDDLFVAMVLVRACGTPTAGIAAKTLLYHR